MLSPNWDATCKRYSGYCLFLAGASHRLKSSVASPREALGGSSLSPTMPTISVFVILNATRGMQKAIFSLDPSVISDTYGLQRSARTPESIVDCSAGEQQLSEGIAKSGPGSEAAAMPLWLSDCDPVHKSPGLSVASSEQEIHLLTALVLCALFLLDLHPELRLCGCNS